MEDEQITVGGAWGPSVRQMKLLERYALGYSWHRSGQMANIPTSTYGEWLGSEHGDRLRALGNEMRLEVAKAAAPQYAAVIEKAQAILLRVGDDLAPDAPLARWAERILGRTLWPALLVRAIAGAGIDASSGSAVRAIQLLTQGAGLPAAE